MITFDSDKYNYNDYYNNLFNYIVIMYIISIATGLIFKIDKKNMKSRMLLK